MEPFPFLSAPQSLTDTFVVGVLVFTTEEATYLFVARTIGRSFSAHPPLCVRGKQEMAVWGVVGCLNVGFIIQKCNILLAYLVNSVSLHYSLWYFSTTFNVV